MPQTQYSAMRGMLAESKIGQSTGAPGLFWEKLMRGEGRETVREYLQKQANAVASGSSSLGIKNLVAKGLGLAAMVATGGASIPAQIAAGSLTSGGLTKYWGDKEVGKLDTSGLDMSKILYGREEAGEAEDTAQSAINRLIEGVDAQAVSNAFTTPLMYYTLQNTFAGGGAGTATGLPNVSTQAANMAKDKALLSGKQALSGWLDPQNLEFATLGEQAKSLGKMGYEDYFKSRFQGIY